MSSRSRKRGQKKGGVALFAHETAPCLQNEHRAVQQKNELEYRPVLILPNRNNRDKLTAAGAFRPPEKVHPPYAPALTRLLKYYKEQHTAALLIGDFSMRSWEVAERGGCRLWLEAEGLGELSDPEVPTYAASTVADGIFLALGEYHAKGILPQEADPEEDGTYPGVHPVFASANTVLADRHALFLDILTLEVEHIPPIRKCSIRSRSQGEWETRNELPDQNLSYRKIKTQATEDNNFQGQYSQLTKPLEATLKDCYRKTRAADDWDAEQIFVHKYAAHELSSLYKNARKEHRDKDWIHRTNVMCRSGWMELLSAVSTGDLKRAAQFSTKRDGRTQPFS